MNYNIKLLWIFIICCLLILTIFFTIDLLKEDKEYFNYNNVSISEADYKAIQEQFKDSPKVRVCNMETKNCFVSD